MKNLFIILFTSCYAISAQTVGTGDEDVKIYVDGGIDGSGIITSASFKEPKPITIGDVYLFSKWVDGVKMFSTTNKEYVILGANYNIQKDAFEIKMSKDSVFSLNSNYIEKIQIIIPLLKN